MAGRCIGIWNTNAAKAEETLEARSRLESICDQVLEPSSRQETIEAVQRLESVRRVIVAGGDGSINAVVNALAPMDDPPTLGLIPLGTANDLCSSLAIPDDPLLALELLEQGPVQPLDLIQVFSEAGEAWCINMATGGNSARVTEALTDELKQRWGALVYLRGVVNVLTALDVFSTTIRLDDQPPEHLEAWNVLLANAQTCGGRIQVAPQADPSDGLIDVIVVKDGTVGDMAGMAAGLITGNYLEHEQVWYRKARRVEIQSKPPMGFTVDGELLDHIPRTFVLHHHKLPVVVGKLHPVPADAAAETGTTAH